MYHILCLLFNYVLYMISPRISQTEYNHENVANSYGISDYFYYTGYWELMLAHMLLNALFFPSVPSTWIHPNTWETDACDIHSCVYLPLHSVPVTLYVFCIAGSTKWREWFTTACDVMFGRLVIVPYAAHSSVWTTVLERVCCWIIPCNVTRSLHCTISM